MELNGVNSSAYTNAATYSTSASQPKTDNAKAKGDVGEAVVYEKSESAATSKKTYGATSKKADAATIEKLKADAEARYSQMASLVEKLMTKQGNTSKIASLSDLMKGVVDGTVEVDEETVAQAKKDVADDGYWGVDQTADRIVSFAKALTGGDASKVEEMRKAVEKGYKEATKTWGDKLPEISKKTLDKVNELMDKWASDSNK